jgi:hypothetical protein
MYFPVVVDVNVIVFSNVLLVVVCGVWRVLSHISTTPSLPVLLGGNSCYCPYYVLSAFDVIYCRLLLEMHLSSMIPIVVCCCFILLLFCCYFVTVLLMYATHYLFIKYNKEVLVHCTINN